MKSGRVGWKVEAVWIGLSFGWRDCASAGPRVSPPMADGQKQLAARVRMRQTINVGQHDGKNRPGKRMVL